MGWALTLGTKTIQILGSYIRDRREYIFGIKWVVFICLKIDSVFNVECITIIRSAFSKLNKQREGVDLNKKNYVA